MQRLLYNLLESMTRNDRQAVDHSLAALREANLKGETMPTIIRPSHNDPARLVIPRMEVTIQEHADATFWRDAERMNAESAKCREALERLIGKRPRAMVVHLDNLHDGATWGHCISDTWAAVHRPELDEGQWTPPQRLGYWASLLHHLEQYDREIEAAEAEPH